jgi:hypothetical protein
MRSRSVTCILAVLVTSFLMMLFPLATECLAGVRWTTNGVGVRSQPATADDASYPRIASDGFGGAIITWYDLRSGKSDIYAQRVDASGNCLWATDGVGVRSQPGTPEGAYAPTIAPDGFGGAIIAWEDRRSGSSNDEIYAQRVDSNGNRLWTTDGVGVRSQPGTPGVAFGPAIATDGSGGAIITWIDIRYGKNDIFSQRVDSNGNRLWTTDGVEVRVTVDGADIPQIASDGNGNAIIAWRDDRAGGSSHSKIYAQKVDSGGNMLWTANGVGVRSDPGTPGKAYAPTIAPDGSGNAIITWYDDRSGKWDIYAQRVDSSGNRLWTTDGVGVRSQPTTASSASTPQIAPDGSGGAIITWPDFRSGSKNDIYAQRVDPNGNRLWTTDGVGVRSQPGTASEALYPRIAPDGSGGAIITWHDRRSGSKYDIYAQRVDPNGNMLWTTDGVGVRTLPATAGDARNPEIATDGSGGAVITWQDFRSGSKYDIYAQRISNDGPTLTGITPSSGYNNGPVNITDLAGTNFQAGATVRFRKSGQPDILANPVNLVSANQITCTIDLKGAAAGTWDVIVANPDGQSCALTGGFTVSYPSSFYFAEGYTGENFAEYLCIGNSNNTAATANVTYMFSDGTTRDVSYNVPADSRYTVNVNDEVGAGKEVSTRVLSETPNLVAERPMYFNYNDVWTGGSDAVGARFPAKNWYFAEGTTLPGFDEYITVQNPGTQTANITFHYMLEGEGRQDVSGQVNPNSRATFKARDHVGDGKNISLYLASDQDIVAERPMYFNYQGLATNNWTGGHDAVGTNYSAKNWYFAEGTTRGGFEEWLCLQNPGSGDITVNATYQLGVDQGDPIAKSYTVPAQQRLTVSVNKEIGGEKDCSVSLASSSDFIAERPMYFDYKTGERSWDGGHDVLGASATATNWLFAEGYTGDNFEEWLCLQNPGNDAANVTITYFPKSGTSVTKPHTVPPNSRLTVNVNTDAGANLEISARVSSDKPIIAERPMYFNYNGVWNGGHDVVGFSP